MNDYIDINTPDGSCLSSFGSLLLYVAEFRFRYKNRMNADIFRAAIKAC